MLAVGVASLLTAAIAFYISVSNAAFNKAALDYWTHVTLKPAHAYRPHLVSVAVDPRVRRSRDRPRRRRARTHAHARREAQPVLPHRLHRCRAAGARRTQRAFRSWRRRAVTSCSTSDDASGDMQHGSKTLPLPELIEQPARPCRPFPGAFELTIPNESRIRAARPDLVRRQRRREAAPPRRRCSPAIERRTVGYFMGSLGAHVDLVARHDTRRVQLGGDRSAQRTDDDRWAEHQKTSRPAEELAARRPGNSKTKPKARR